MRYTIPAGTYFDIPVRIHFTFPLILIAFAAEAWWHGTWLDAVRALVLILAVFVCVVLHEFGHSLQVKRYGITVRDIVLLPIGGMARAERIPDKPWQEIIVAISGPAVNFVLAGMIFAVLWMRGGGLREDDFLTSLLLINLVLGTFNLIPAFPMDGGRILRGLLALRLPYLRATRVARAVGQVIALAFVVIGFKYSAFLMLPVIAVFIFFGAMSEENLVRVRYALEDRTVGDLLRGDGDMLLLDAPASSAAAVLAAASPRPVAATDSSGAVTGAVYPRAVRDAVREGHGDVPLARLAVFDFPVMRFDMPAIQAYYFLKAEKKPFAGVVDDDGFRGLVHFDRFLDAPS